MELTGLQILDGCLYDEREVDTAWKPLSVDMEFSGEKTPHKFLPVQSEGCGELSEAETGLGQHLPHVGDEELGVGGREGLAGQGDHLGRHVALQGLQTLQTLAVVLRVLRLWRLWGCWRLVVTELELVVVLVVVVVYHCRLGLVSLTLLSKVALLAALVAEQLWALFH